MESHGIYYRALALWPRSSSSSFPCLLPCCDSIMTELRQKAVTVTRLGSEAVTAPFPVRRRLRSNSNWCLSHLRFVKIPGGITSLADVRGSSAHLRPWPQCARCSGAGSSPRQFLNSPRCGCAMRGSWQDQACLRMRRTLPLGFGCEAAMALRTIRR